MTPSRGNRRSVVRPHVITGGRARPSRNIFDLATLVYPAPDRPLTGLGPEQLRVMRLCRGGMLSVAEVAGHLRLPLSVTRVLLSDLFESGHIRTRAPIARAEVPQAELLIEVIRGLQRL